MTGDQASTNVNRNYTLAGTSIAIFTFMLIFLFPRQATGEAEPVLFQATLAVMGFSTFSFVFATFHFYAASLEGLMDEAERARASRQGDRFWMLGYTLLFLAPSLVLFSVRLLLVGAVWLSLWIAYLLFALRAFSRIQGRQ